MAKLFITFLLSCLSLYAEAQTWSPYQELYTDNNISVEISFRYSPTACDVQGVSSKYRYRIKGKLYSTKKYVTWKMDYIHCNGIKYIETNSVNIGLNGYDGIIESLDYTFQGKELEKEIYGISTSHLETKEKKELKGLHSVLPQQIIGGRKIYKGESLTLSFREGMLAAGAQWKWYADSCGGEAIGSGMSITVSPEQTTRYYLKAESNLAASECIYTTVDVSEESKLPTSIYGHSNICTGQTVKLSFVGGKLGENSEWVWYEGSCTGKKAGRGEILTVAPTENTTYFLKATGEFGTTVCISKRVLVETASTAPQGIISGSGTIVCHGTPVQLKVSGGELGREAQWVWYKNNIQPSNKVATGTNVSLFPTEKTRYLVRAEGECGNTTTVSSEIEVLPPPEAPVDIKSEDDQVYKGKKTTLRVLSLNETGSFNWIWNEGKCGGKQIGTGESLRYKFKNPVSISVYSTNTCGASKCITKTFQPLSRSIANTKAEPEKKFQLGFELGANFIGLAPVDKNTTSFKTGIGAETGLMFHPLYKKNIILGLGANFIIGKYFFGKSPVPIKESHNYYTIFQPRVELAAGIKHIKFLTSYTNKMYTEKYSLEDKSRHKESHRQDKIGFGLRIGSNFRNPRAIYFDIAYLMTRKYDWSWNDFNWKFKTEQDWGKGISASVWVHNAVKIDAEVLFKTSNPGYYGNAYNLGIKYNLNRYY